MLVIAFGAAYLLAAVAIAELLIFTHQMPPGVSVLMGFAFAVVAGLSHIALYTLQRLSAMEVRLLRNQKEIEAQQIETQHLSDELQQASMGTNPDRYEDVLSEVKIMQNLIDQILRGDSQNTLATARAAAITTIDQANDAHAGSEMNDHTVLSAVREAIRADRIEIFLQPIVSLPQRKPRFYEMFSRIRLDQGGYLLPERYINIPAGQELVQALDNLQLIRCIQMLRDTERRNSPLRFFCNIASNTLRDTNFMTELVQFLGQNAALAPKLIFELAQADLQQLPPDMLPVLDGLGRLGCRFSMDQVYDLNLPITALIARKIKTVKVDSDLLLEHLRQPSGEMRLRELKVLLDRNGIDLIGSKIESEQQLRELLDLSIDFGQGYLFGEPRANWPLG